MKDYKENKDDELDDIEPRKPVKKVKETDLPDNEHDRERMKPEEVILDLPDAEEIPGQEHIHVPQMREMQDVTIASDDEEGVGIFGDDDEDEDTRLVMGNEADVSRLEQEMLERRTPDTIDDADMKLKRAELDEIDNEGVPLNEGSLATDVSGSDLDTSGVDEDNAMENIGEEDEENNLYSLGGDNKENLEEGKS